MLAAIARVHILQHTLPFAVGEVDVDVRRLGALLAQEALEEQLELDRVHRRDAEAVADGAVGRRAAALAEDPLAARVAHDVPDDQEVARESELRDERELVRELLVVPRGALPSPTFLGAALHQTLEVFVLAHALRQREVRQLRLERLEPERAAVGDRERVREPLFPSAPPCRELGVTLEVPLTIGAEARAHLVERRAMAQGGEHVVREATARTGVVHVVGHHPRKVVRGREREQALHQRALLGQRMVPALHGDPSPERFGECAERGMRVTTERQQLRHPPARTARECEESARVRDELVERHARFAARMIQSCARDQRAEIPPAFARLDEADDVRPQARYAVLAEHAAGQRRCGGETESGGERNVDGDLCALDRRESGGARGGRETHRAAHVVVVGEGEGVQAEGQGSLHEALGVGGAVEEGEGGVAVEFGVPAHGCGPRATRAAERSMTG